MRDTRPSRPVLRLATLMPGSPLPTLPPSAPSARPEAGISARGFQHTPYVYGPLPPWLSPVSAERKSFRHAMWAAGLCMFASPVLQLVLSFFLSRLMVVLYQTMGFGATLTNNGWQLLVIAVVYPLSYLIPLLILRAVTRIPFVPLLSMHHAAPSFLLSAPALVLGGSVAGALADILLTNITAGLGWVSYGSSPQPASFGLGDLLVYIFVLTVLPAFLEEFFFRGALLSMLRRFGDGFAILFTAVGFALIHGNLEQMPAALITGLILGLITVKSGSIWPAVVAHFLNNFLSTITGIWFATLPNQTAVLYSLLMYVLFLILGLLACLLMLRHDSGFAQLPRPLSLTTGAQKLGMIFSNPGTLLFVAICLLLVVQSFQRVY